MHMISYFYVYDCHKNLGDASLEVYKKAIAYNKEVIKNNENSMGLSINRETFVLEWIIKELVEGINN